MKIRKFTIGLFLATVALLTMQNIDSVDVHFLNYSFHAPKAIVISLVFFLGLGVGWLLAWKKFSHRHVTNDD